MSTSTDYVLGTHDEEIARLDLQHRVWRAEVHDAWRRAGFGAGQHLIDVGCGPGFATLDLAALVGGGGRVTAVDRSRRFLDLLAAAARAQGRSNITAREDDLDAAGLAGVFDGAWIRWVLAFVRDPRALLQHVYGVLAPGAPLVIHEYFDNTLWQLTPRSLALEQFVRIASDNWRQSGGEPNIGLALLPWLDELGYEIVALRPLVEIIAAEAPKWAWLTAFIDSTRHRLVGSGQMTVEESAALAAEMRAWRAAEPPVRMMTPGVLEIVAVRPFPR